MFIETERLIIRSIEPEDEAAYIDMASDGSLRDIFGDCSDCRDWMASWIQEAQALDREDDPTREYLAYAVTEKSQGTLLGSVGCSYYEDLKQVGVTFFIGSAFRGRGYAAEAAAAYVQYFFAHYDIYRLIATVRDTNIASWKTIERAGFDMSEVRTYRDINDEKNELYRFYEQIDPVYSVLAHWNLQGSRIQQIYDTAWQVGDDYVLKVYQDRKMLERNLKMIQLLAGRDIPVAQIVPACGNALYVTDHNCFYFLSKKLAGDGITQIDSPKDLARTMGVIIARLHTAFQECEPLDMLWDNSLLDEMNGWVRESMENNGWQRISREEYEQVVSQLAALYEQLPVQIIHRDIHFGNFLFADGVFSGYIDFDLSQRNIRLFDLCYFLLGLLSEEEGLRITESTWLCFLRDLFAGYESVLTLSEAEKKAVPYVMECIELLFVAWFDNEKNDSCAENAYKIYKFVRQREDELSWESVTA